MLPDRSSSGCVSPSSVPDHRLRRNGPHQFGNIVPGVYTPVLAKHSKHFSLEDSLASRFIVALELNSTQHAMLQKLIGR